MGGQGSPPRAVRDNGRQFVPDACYSDALERIMAVRKRRATDRRVRKTGTRLHEALMSLIHDKRYDSIAVRDILDPADVGRSTFYAHFRDKDDLLASGIYDALQSIRSTAAAALDPFAW